MSIIIATFALTYTGRNVKAESPDTIDKAMNSLKENGFINYYGQIKFTSSIYAVLMSL